MISSISNRNFFLKIIYLFFNSFDLLANRWLLYMIMLKLIFQNNFKCFIQDFTLNSMKTLTWKKVKKMDLNLILFKIQRIHPNPRNNNKINKNKQLLKIELSNFTSQFRNNLFKIY